jgi:hypothetical protein
MKLLEEKKEILIRRRSSIEIFFQFLTINLPSTQKIIFKQKLLLQELKEDQILKDDESYIYIFLMKVIFLYTDKTF